MITQQIQPVAKNSRSSGCLCGNNNGALAFKSAELADLYGCATDTCNHLA